MDFSTKPANGQQSVERPIELRPEPANDDTLTRSNNVSDIPFPALSKNVTRRKRRSDRVDKQALETIRKIGSSITISGVGTVSNAHSSDTRTTTHPEEAIPSANDNRLPAWIHTGDRMKFNMAMRALEGRAHAFTINLGPERLKEALEHPDGFSRCLSRYMNRALERVLGRIPLYLFSVEMTGRGKIHVHGAIESTVDELARVEEALTKAAGAGWQKRRRGETQVYLQELNTADGWAEYSLRDGAKARRVITGKSVFIAKRLRPLAEATYLKAKKASGAAR